MSATSNYANSSNPVHSAEYLNNLAEMRRRDEELMRQREEAKRAEQQNR